MMTWSAILIVASLALDVVLIGTEDEGMRDWFRAISMLLFGVGLTLWFAA